MLRPGVACALRRGHLTAWGRQGYVLAWPGATKTRPGDVCEARGTPQAQWHVTACGHRAVIRVLDAYSARASGDGSRLWPEVTPPRVMAWLRRVRAVTDEETPRLAAHGFRLGTDLELHELGAPADVINLLGWWARDAAPGKCTRAYYNSTHLGMMLMETARLGQSQTHHPAPGVHTGTPSQRVDWDTEWLTFQRGLPRQVEIRQHALMASLADVDNAIAAD